MQKNIILSFLFAILTLFTVDTVQAKDHPFHVSVTELIFNPSTNHWEMSLKIFTDDLENALKRNYDTGILNLGTNDENDKANDFIVRYLSEKLTMKVDGTPVEMEYIGREGDLDAQWMYIEFISDKPHGKLSFSNTVFIRIVRCTREHCSSTIPVYKRV